MPFAPKRPCTKPGCGALTDGGACPKHRRQQDYQRGSAAERGYGHAWQKAREGWLRSHPLCGDRISGSSSEHSACVRAGLIVAATDVDHIEPHHGDARLMWDRNNWQSLCHVCHSAKTAAEDGGFGNAG